MTRFYQILFPAMWLSWSLYWLIRFRSNKRTVQRESVASRLLHLVPLAIALLLLWLPPPWFPILEQRVLPLSAWQVWAPTGATLTLAGLMFAVWARVHLGNNWSAAVTIKQGHELITSGPYHLVRHPIYTGLILAFLGQAIAHGAVSSFVAIAIVYLTFARKLHNEERLMRQQFGDTYVAYARRVPALIPFIPGSQPQR